MNRARIGHLIFREADESRPNRDVLDGFLGFSAARMATPAAFSARMPGS